MSFYSTWLFTIVNDLQEINWPRQKLESPLPWTSAALQLKRPGTTACLPVNLLELHCWVSLHPAPQQAELHLIWMKLQTSQFSCQLFQKQCHFLQHPVISFTLSTDFASVPEANLFWGYRLFPSGFRRATHLKSRTGLNHRLQPPSSEGVHLQHSLTTYERKMQTRDQHWRFQHFSENYPYSNAFKQITSENRNTTAIKPNLMSSSKRSQAISAGRTLLSIPELRQLIPARALLWTRWRQEAAAFHIPKQKPSSDCWDKEEFFCCEYITV